MAGKIIKLTAVSDFGILRIIWFSVKIIERIASYAMDVQDPFKESIGEAELG